MERSNKEMKMYSEQYRALVEGYSAQLYRYAYWLSGSKEVAEDLVQETYLRAWRSMGDLREINSAKSWLITILRRENARRFERKKLEQDQYKDVESLPSTAPGYDTSTEAFVLRKVLKDFPDEYREPLVLQVLMGYSCEEIAQILGSTQGAIMTRLCRARKMLREKLTADDVSSKRENV